MIVILLSVRETEKRYENVKRRRDYLILKKNYVYRTIDISPSGNPDIKGRRRRERRRVRAR